MARRQGRRQSKQKKKKRGDSPSISSGHQIPDPKSLESFIESRSDVPTVRPSAKASPIAAPGTGGALVGVPVLGPEPETVTTAEIREDEEVEEERDRSGDPQSMAGFWHRLISGRTVTNDGLSRACIVLAVLVPLVIHILQVWNGESKELSMWTVWWRATIPFPFLLLLAVIFGVWNAVMEWLKSKITG